MKSRIPARSASAALALVAALSGPAQAQQQSPAQQRCIVSLFAAATRLASVRAKGLAACLSDVALGGRPMEPCYAFDPQGKIAAAEAKLAQVDGKRCATSPDFGRAGLAAASGTASAEVVELLRQLHGALPPDPVLPTPACLDVVHDRSTKLLQRKLKAFSRCAKAGLAAGDVTSSETLAACLGEATAAADPRLAKLVLKLERSVAKACPGAASLPGCATPGAAGAAACIDRIADCRACGFAKGVGGAVADCDLLDDGVLDGSCRDACGNGSVTAPELCDDGNLVSGDGCDRSCRPSGCGSGVVTAGEACDGAMGRCEGGELDGTPCYRNAECGGGQCTSCPPGGCNEDCAACGAGTCCDTMFGCLFVHEVEQDCAPIWGGSLVACDAPACQHSGTCCKHLYLDWGGCHSDPFVLANCEAWQGRLAPCAECTPCCAFDGYCTSWDEYACLEHEGTPVDCSQCWGP